MPLGDVFVEAAGSGPGEQDPLHGGVLEGAETLGMIERLGQVGGVIALAQGQDMSCVVACRPRSCPLQTGQEGLGL